MILSAIKESPFRRSQLDFWKGTDYAGSPPIAKSPTGRSSLR
jgi:hypothetical protein